MAAVSQETTCYSYGRLITLSDMRQVSNDDRLLQCLQDSQDLWLE
jgi:hypothetical protein